MTETLIHVGYHKTGTTWLKSHFFRNVKNAGIVYYDDFNFNLTAGKEFFEIKPEKMACTKDFRIITAHVLSGFINGRWENGAYRKLFSEYFKSNFPDAHIILFIRNQLDMIPSFYSSYLRKGGSLKIDELFSARNIDGGGFFSFSMYDFAEMISFYQHLFGKDKVHVFLYEDFLEDNASFLYKLSAKFGFDINIDQLTYAKSNEKLRKGLVTTVRFLNMFSARGAQPKKCLFDLPFMASLMTKERLNKWNSYAVFGKKDYRNDILGKTLKETITSLYKNSNRRLIEEFGLKDVQKYGYPL